MAKPFPKQLCYQRKSFSEKFDAPYCKTEKNMIYYTGKPVSHNLLACRCGGIGRRTALKMRREIVPVRVRSPADGINSLWKYRLYPKGTCGILCFVVKINESLLRNRKFINEVFFVYNAVVQFYEPTTQNSR